MGRQAVSEAENSSARVEGFKRAKNRKSDDVERPTRVEVGDWLKGRSAGFRGVRIWGRSSCGSVLEINLK